MKKWNDDSFTKKARKENFLARSIYKLEEIDRRDRVIQQGNCIIDLGASPGSWTQYCLNKTGKSGKVIAVDIQPMKLTHENLIFIEESIETVDLTSHIGSKGCDVVLSDMAPNTSGVHERDTALSFELSQLALETSLKFLKPRGHFVCKIFMGEDFELFRKNVAKHFEETKLLRPESTRKHSREVFIIGKYRLKQS